MPKHETIFLDVIVPIPSNPTSQCKPPLIRDTENAWCVVSSDAESREARDLFRVCGEFHAIRTLNSGACLRSVTASVRDDSAARAGAQRLPATISYRLSSR
jgi:hypothetical protein